MQQLGILTAPRLDLPCRDLEEGPDPHRGDDELATFRIRQAQRPTQGGLGANRSIRTNQDAHGTSLPFSSSRPRPRVSR